MLPTVSKPALGRKEIHDALDAFAGFQIGEDEGPCAAHAPRVAVHDVEAGADQWGEIGLVDDEEVGAGNARPAFARDLVTGSDIDHVDRQICEFGRESRSEVVAARLDQQQIEIREQLIELGNGGEVDRGVFADGGTRATAGLDAADPVRRQGAAAGQEFGVLAGIDVVGPLTVLSRLFRRLFLARLVARLAPLGRKNWFVYAKPPFTGPEAVLAYLARYTHRVAISNSRLLALDERGVSFRYKDYRRNGRERFAR
jgi:hypothetical protein